MKKIIYILLMGFIIIIFSAITNGCSTPQKIADKDGAQLWGENCQRCHNTPSPADFSDAQWETIGMHMKLRANITNMEREKVVAFLQSANKGQ